MQQMRTFLQNNGPNHLGVGQFLGFSVMVGSWWLTLVGLSYLLRYANPSEHGDYDRSIWFE